MGKEMFGRRIIGPNADSVDALRLMQKSHSKRLMVVDRGRLVAIVSWRDLMDFLATKLELQDPPMLTAA